MKTMLKKLAVVLAAGLMATAATGCSFRFAASPDDLYSLPKLPAEYTELSGEINRLLSDGAEYAAPVSGTNIQSVQMVDLDGDGQEEALAFLRNPSEEKPLKIVIFAKDRDGYVQTARIEGNGTAINSVNYRDLNQDGWMELLVGWKVGTEPLVLTVYSLRGPEPEELARTNYVKYAVTDLNEGAEQELVVLHADDEGSGVADYYTWTKEGSPRGSLTQTSSARLSMTMAELNSGRVTAGTLQGGTPALFVTGVSDSSVAVTDILVTRGGELSNVTLSATTGVSAEMYRYQSLFPMDIDGDGVTELPAPAMLPGVSINELYYRIDWRSYDSTGLGETVKSTYHDMEDGWYLELPEAWQGKIRVSRAPSGVDEMAVTFSLAGNPLDEPRDFLRIYTITGDSREIKAGRGDRFLLSRQTETIYAAELLEANSGWNGAITEDQLRANFKLIAKEWRPGDN